MSLQRKVYRVLVSVWEALVTCWYFLVIASLAVLTLFLAAFVISMAFELSERLVAP